jgi:SAM-dependent methyltransferase
LSVASALDEDGEIFSGHLACDRSGHGFPIHDFIPRFVPEENYANNFGFQWNRFRRTQLDSHSGHPISRDRFFAATGWKPEELRGARVLDVGCGAGRFTEIALSSGAQVVSLDYSSAVEACRANNASHGQLDVVRGDIYHLPFKPGTFDFVYCLGVLQHTPDVERAFHCLLPPLRPGGRLAVDVYERRWTSFLAGRRWARPITTRMNRHRLYGLVERFVPRLLPLTIAIGRIPVVGRKARRILPIADYDGILPLSRDQLTEWAILDTYDMLAPVYDQPQTEQTLRRWLAQAQLEDGEVLRPAGLVARGRKH